MPRRIFIGVAEVAGYFANLQRGFEARGISTTYLDLSGHPFGYRPTGLVGRWGRMSIALAIRAARARGAARRMWRAAWLVTYAFQIPVRIALLAAAVARHDVFILSSDTWVHQRIDLPLLKFMRKRVILVFTGSDHRPPYLDGWFRTRESEPDWHDLARSTRKTRQRVRRAERYADEIVALPASAHFHKRRVIDFLHVGIPFAAPERRRTQRPSPFRGDGVKILHSASNAEAKGTSLVRAAIAELRTAGYAIDYHEVVRGTHDEVLAGLEACDLVVDEVFSDTPMAAFATEAAAFGKPAVVTGYYADAAGERLSAEDAPPSLFEPPDKLRAAIERLVRDEPFRRDLGSRARTFVLDRWSPAAVAERYLRIIAGSVPDEWRWDPAAQRYLYGWGMDRQRVVATLRELIAREGVASLGLDHNPDLESRMVQLASGS